VSNTRGLSEAQVERKRCVDIVRKTAAFYREQAVAFDLPRTKDRALSQAEALDEVARTIEDA
jgi:hypothetical protein